MNLSLKSILFILMEDIISHQLSSVQFDFYTANDIRKMSVKQITEPVAFDTLGRPVLGGLYDPALGVSPYDKTPVCVTCGLDSVECPGHFGHIELPACVYNPFNIGLINKLLNSKCFHCHKLRLREKDKNYFYFRILLIKLGLINESEKLKSILSNVVFRDDNSIANKISYFIKTLDIGIKSYDEDNTHFNLQEVMKIKNEGSEGSIYNTEANTTLDEEGNLRSTDKKGEKDCALQAELRQFKEKEFELILLKIKDKIKQQSVGNVLNDQNTDIQLHLKTILKEFWGATKLQKCPNCNSFAIKVKKQGYLKFFKYPLSDKKKKQMKFSGISTTKEALDGEKSREQTTDKKKKVKKTKSLSPGHYESDDVDEDDEIGNSEKVSSNEAKYLHPEEVKELLKRLWNRDRDLLSLIFGNIFKNPTRKNLFCIESSGVDIFFLETILVPPIRFRPENRGGGDGGVFLHHQSVMLTKIINVNSDMRLYSKQLAESLSKGKSPQNNSELLINQSRETLEKIASFKDLVSKWIELQEHVNMLYDGSKASKLQDKETNGIRQLLEKKEGIFRMKMMGKRVNYAGRSVVSPDPMISTGEVGVPLHIAVKMTIPEEVTDFNRKRLKQLIMNGPLKHPGANMIETIGGKKILLDSVKQEIRLNKLARSLDDDLKDDKTNKFKVKTVFRHLQNGDALLVNRQPTLHRPSIMSHRAKILPGEKTIRLHYSNCSSYNADFDGDEMNIHLLQSQIARQEAYSISNTENQYIVPTSGNPIRGLIQDSVVSSVLLTLKDNFFTRQEFFQLVYSSLESTLNSNTISHIVIPEPAIFKPKMLWTGKQVVSCVLKSLITKHPIFGHEDQKYSNRKVGHGLNMEIKTRIGEDKWTASHKNEAHLIIRDNDLLTGIVDKNQIGNSGFGIVHSYYELYGPSYAGELLTTFCKLFINYLQFFHGYTCGVGDLILNTEINLKRRADSQNILKEGMSALAKNFGMDNFELTHDNYSKRAFITKQNFSEELISLPPKIQEEAKRMVRNQNFKITEDSFKDKSSIIKELEALESNDPAILQRIDDLEISLKNEEMIEELRTKIHEMVLKDDSIEEHLDSVVKGATNDASKCLNFWINNGLIKRFPDNLFALMVLTGAKGSNLNHTLISCLLGQQELEGRRVPRMASGRTLPSFKIFDPNPRSGGYIIDRFSTGIRLQEFFFHCMAGREGLIDTAVKTSRSGYLQRCLVKHLEQLVVHYDNTVRDTDGKVIQFLYGEDGIDPVNSNYINNYDFIQNNHESYLLKYNPQKLVDLNMDCKSVKRYIKENPDFLKDYDTVLSKYSPSTFIGSKSNKVIENSGKYALKLKDQFRKKFSTIVDLKYFNSLVHPGENVGIIAAQGIGEPSTQMTLNTFHLAGHGGANVTLGIPRLREILMTSENNIKTPIMILVPRDGCNEKDIQKVGKYFENFYLIDIVKEINISNSLNYNQHGKAFERVYNFDITLENMSDIYEYFECKYDTLDHIIKSKFLPTLSRTIHKHFKLAKDSVNEPIQQSKFKESKLGNASNMEEAVEKDNLSEQDIKAEFKEEEADKSRSDTESEVEKDEKEENDEDEKEVEDDAEDEEDAHENKQENTSVHNNIKKENGNGKEKEKYYFSTNDVQIRDAKLHKTGKLVFTIVLAYSQKPILLKK